MIVSAIGAVQVLKCVAGRSNLSFGHGCYRVAGRGHMLKWHRAKAKRCNPFGTSIPVEMAAGADHALTA